MYVTLYGTSSYTEKSVSDSESYYVDTQYEFKIGKETTSYSIYVTVFSLIPDCKWKWYYYIKKVSESIFVNKTKTNCITTDEFTQCNFNSSAEIKLLIFFSQLKQKFYIKIFA